MEKNYVRKYLRWWLNMVFMHPLGTKDWLGEKKTAKRIGGPEARKSMCVYTSMSSYKHA